MSDPRVIDLKLPLSSVIAGAITVLSFMAWMGYQAATQTNKLDAVIVSNVKMEKRLDDRDARIDTVRDGLFELRRANDMNTMRINALESRK